MKNSKGFTLTELLAVLAIIGILLVIAVPSFSRLLEKNKKDYYNKLDKTVLTTIKTYYKDNVLERPTELLNATIVDYDALINGKYIDNISLYNSNNRCTGYGVIVKDKDDYLYANCMKCDDEYKNYKIVSNASASFQDKICDIAWEDNTSNITKTFSIPRDMYGYVNPNYKNNKESAEKLQTSLCISETIMKKNDSSILLMEIESVARKSCPIDITNINPKSVGAYKVKYRNGDSTYHVFQHPAPTVSGASTMVMKGSTITLKIDDTRTFGYKNKTEVVSDINRFEYTEDDGTSWHTACVPAPGSYQCNFEINKSYDNIKFRVVGKGTDGSSHYGKITDASYDITMKYWVTLDANGGKINGSNTEKIEVYKGGTYDLSTNPTRTGYTFVDWQDESGKIYNNGSTVEVEAEHTLKATWSANSYVVTFDPNGGSVSPTSKTVKFGDKYGDLPDKNATTRAGYTFLGWTTEKNGGSTITNDTPVTKSNDHYVYALWRANVLTIHYYANGGKFSSTADLTHRLDYGYTDASLVKYGIRDYTASGGSAYATRSGYTGTGYWLVDSPTATKKISQATGYANSQAIATAAGKDLSIGDVEINLYAEWIGAVQTITTTTCQNKTLSAGVYYVEIVGGGAGGHGQYGHEGGDAARWAGYVYLPGGSAKVCVGKGTAGQHGVFSAPGNGGNSYIQIGGKNVVVAAGGKDYKTTYSNATTTFANGAVAKKSCYNVKGRKGKHDSISGTQYGAGGATEWYNPGKYTDAYDGTSGIIKYQYIKTAEQWDANPITSCPSPKCSNDNCGWTGF